jgi:hypothetical protein
MVLELVAQHGGDLVSEPELLHCLVADPDVRVSQRRADLNRKQKAPLVNINITIRNLTK